MWRPFGAAAFLAWIADVIKGQPESVKNGVTFAPGVTFEYDRLLGAACDGQAGLVIVVGGAASHPVAALPADSVQLAEYEVECVSIH
jgi:hypothetical protein